MILQSSECSYGANPESFIKQSKNNAKFHVILKRNEWSHGANPGLFILQNTIFQLHNFICII